ncbi:MAG: DUF3095 family protein [Balneolales bacterium]
MNPSAFYNRLNIIYSLREAINHKHYTPLPQSWYIAAADIHGSTDAIREGKYKEVNMAGASIIAALNNLLGHPLELPFLFGGDGSLIALSDYKIKKVKGVLAYCRKVVKNAYDLDMRVGLISVKEIREMAMISG